MQFKNVIDQFYSYFLIYKLYIPKSNIKIIFLGWGNQRTTHILFSSYTMPRTHNSDERFRHTQCHAPVIQMNEGVVSQLGL